MHKIVFRRHERVSQERPRHLERAGPVPLGPQPVDLLQREHRIVQRRQQLLMPDRGRQHDDQHAQHQPEHDRAAHRLDRADLTQRDQQLSDEHLHHVGQRDAETEHRDGIPPPQPRPPVRQPVRRHQPQRRDPEPRRAVSLRDDGDEDLRPGHREQQGQRHRLGPPGADRPQEQKADRNRAAAKTRHHQHRRLFRVQTGRQERPGQRPQQQDQRMLEPAGIGRR